MAAKLPQQARARARRRQLLTAAASVFARRGYADAAIDEIAREAETSKGGLYFHFPGKEALLLAVLDATATLLRRKVEAAMAEQDSPVLRAEAALGTLLRTLRRHRTLARVFAVEAGAAGPTFHGRVAEIQEEYVDLVRGELDRAVAAGLIDAVDTDIVARAWVGMLNAILTRWALGLERRSLDSVYPELRRLFLRSVGAEAFAAKEESHA